MPEPDLTAELDASEDIVMGRVESVVTEWGVRRPDLASGVRNYGDAEELARLVARNLEKHGITRGRWRPMPPDTDPVTAHKATCAACRDVSPCTRLPEVRAASRRAPKDSSADCAPAESGQATTTPATGLPREGETVSGVPCKCGRFLAKPHALCDSGGEGYNFHVFLSDVRGDCQRCGPDVQAMRGDGWWWSWDAWKWPAELESL